MESSDNPSHIPPVKDIWNELRKNAASLHDISQELSQHSQEYVSKTADQMNITQVEDKIIHDILERANEVHSKCYELLSSLQKHTSILNQVVKHDCLNTFAPISYLLACLKTQYTPEKTPVIKRLTWIFKELVESLVYWVDRNSIHLSEVPVGNFLQNIQEHLEAVFTNKNIELSFDDPSAVIVAHEGILGNLIINIANNAFGHAKANFFKIHVTMHIKSLEIQLSNDGEKLTSLSQITRGIGLMQAEERLEMMNATFEAYPTDSGALFKIHFPVPEHISSDK